MSEKLEKLGKTVLEVRGVGRTFRQIRDELGISGKYCVYGFSRCPPENRTTPKAHRKTAGGASFRQACSCSRSGNSGASQAQGERTVRPGKGLVVVDAGDRPEQKPPVPGVRPESSFDDERAKWQALRTPISANPVYLGKPPAPLKPRERKPSMADSDSEFYVKLMGG